MDTTGRLNIASYGDYSYRGQLYYGNLSPSGKMSGVTQADPYGYTLGTQDRSKLTGFLEQAKNITFSQFVAPVTNFGGQSPGLLASKVQQSLDTNKPLRHIFKSEYAEMMQSGKVVGGTVDTTNFDSEVLNPVGLPPGQKEVAKMQKVATQYVTVDGKQVPVITGWSSKIIHHVKYLLGDIEDSRKQEYRQQYTTANINVAAPDRLVSFMTGMFTGTSIGGIQTGDGTGSRTKENPYEDFVFTTNNPTIVSWFDNYETKTKKNEIVNYSSAKVPGVSLAANTSIYIQRNQDLSALIESGKRGLIEIASPAWTWNELARENKSDDALQKQVTAENLDLLVTAGKQGSTIVIYTDPDRLNIPSQYKRYLRKHAYFAQSKYGAGQHSNVQTITTDDTRLVSFGTQRVTDNRQINAELRFDLKKIVSENLKAAVQYIPDRLRATHNVWKLRERVSDKPVVWSLLQQYYSPAYSDLQKKGFTQTGKMPVMPTVMPEDFYRYFAPGTDVTMYTDRYRALAGENPQGIQSYILATLDKKLSDPGLGVLFNQVTGQSSLYQSGRGVVETAAASLGRFLDTMTGYYTLKTFRAREEGELSGSAEEYYRRRYSYPYAKDEQRGFFENLFTNTTNIVSATTVSMAGYFGVTHAYSLARAEIESVGVDYMLNTIAAAKQDAVGNLFLGQMLSPQHALLIRKAEEITEASRTADNLISHSGLGLDLYLKQSFNQVTQQLLSDPSLNLADKAPNVENVSNALAPEFTRGSYNSNFRVLAIFDDLSAANGESFGGILKNKLQQKITAHGLTEAINIGHLNQWMYEIYSEMGINLSEGQVDLGRDLSGVPTYRVNQFGGFINLAGVRRLDSSNLANMFIPLLDEIVYDASDVKYQVAKSSLIHLSSANPILTFKVQMGATYNATQLDIQNYGYTRMENLAKVFDTLAEHIPANPFMWIKPIRQLFSARPDAPSLSQLNIEGYNNQQYAGASFKDLIGPGFSGLITLQKQIAREVGNMARVGLQKHFTEAFGIFQTTRQFERASREFSKVIGVADNAAQATAVVAGSINSVGSSYNNLVAAQQDYHRVIATQKHSYLDSLQSESPKSQSFAGLRRFMLAAGTVLIVDRLVDTYLIRPQGADYFDTVLSDVFGSRSPDLQNDNDEQYSALYATKYSAGVPAAIKYGSAAAGYFIGGHIFPDYTTEDSPVYALLKQRFGGTATADDIIRGVDPAGQLTGVGAVATEAADNAKLITKTYTKARFGGGGALLTSLAALVGSQLLVSYASAITQPLVQTAAGIFLGRRYDPETGLQLDAAKASVSGVLAEIVARSAQSQADAYQRGEAVSATDKANTYVLSLLANQMQVSDAKPTQVFYSFATQIASPFFQFASVSKVDPRNNRVEMAGGLQLFPLLGVGMMLPSPLMPKVRYTEGISTEALRKYLTVYRRGSTSETVPLNADQQMQVSAFTNAQEQDKFNSLLLGGGMNLGFDPKGLIYLSMVGAVKERADNLYQRYSQLPEGHKLRRELQEYKTLFQLGKVGLDTLEMVSRAGMSIVPSVPNYLMRAGIAVTNAGYTVTHRAGPLARVVSPYALSFAILGATFRFRDKATDADITQHSELLNQLSSGQTTTAAGIINKYTLINLTQVAIGTAIVGGTLASTGAFSSARSFADSYNLVESGAQSNYIQRKQHKIYQMWLEHLQKVKEIDLPGQPKVAVSTVEEATAAYAKITEQLVKGDNLEDSAAYYKAAQQIDLPLLRTMPTRLGMAARRTGPLLLGAIVAAQYLSVMDEFKDSPWFGVFKTLGDVRTSRYTPEQMALLSSLGIRQPKYMARNYGDATRNSLDYILSAATLPFGNMFGLFRDDPNPFAPVVGSIGASLGSNDNARLYVQSQSVAADISGSLYLMPEMVSQLGLAMQYGNLLKAASGENKLSESIAYHLIRGSSLRRTPAKIKGGPGINEYRAATSPLLQIAIANRYERIKQLSWQSASELYLDVVRDFARAGRIKNDYLEGTADGVISTPVNSAKLIIYDTLGNLKMSRYRNSRDLNYRRKDNSLPFFKAVKSMLRSAGTFGTGIEVETQEDLNDFNKRSQDKQGNQILSYFAGLGKYVAESYYDTSKEEYQADNTNMAGAAILTLSTAALALSSAGTFTTAIVQAAGALAAYNEHGTVQNLREEVITLRESSIRRLSKTRFSVRDGKLMRPSYNNGLARTLNVSVSNKLVSALNQVFAVASDYNGYMQGNANPLETIASSQLNTVAKQIASAHLGTGSNFLNLVTELQDVKNSIDSVLTIVDDADKSLNVSQAIQKTAGQIEFFNVNEVAAEIQTLLQQNTSRQSIQLGIERILLRTFNEGIARVTHYEAFETSKEPYFNPTYTSQEAYSKQKVKESMRQQVSMAKHATEAIADYDPSIGYLRSRIQAKGYSGLFGEALGGAVRLGSELLNAKAYYELLSYSARMSSSDPFERRRATYAAASSTVQTFGFLIPAQYLLKGIQANPKAAVGGLVLTAGLFAVGLTSRFIRETAQEKVLKPIFKFGDQQIYRPFVSAVAGLYGGAMRIPGFNMLPKLISPITSVIDPIFYNIRRSAEQDPAMSFLANLFIPEDIESFYSRQSEQPRRMTHWGPSPYLYSQGEVNQYYASKAKAKRRRGKTLGSGLDSDLVHSFLTGSTGENQYDQLLAKRYLSGEGRILNDFTPDRLISNSLRLALERRQGTIDQYLEGRYYRRPVHRQTVYEKFALVNSLTLFSYAKTGNMFAAPADNLASASDSLFRGFAQLSQLIDIAPKTQQGLIFAALGMVGTGFGAKALLQSGLDSEDSTSRDIAKITIGVSSLTSGAAGLFLGRRYYQQLSGLGLALPRASLGGLLGFTIGANVGYNLTTGNEQDKQQAAAWSGVAGAAIVAPALGLFDAPRFVGNVATGTAFKIAKLGTGILKLGKPLLNQLGKFQGAGHLANLAKGTAIGLVMAGLTTALIKSNYDWAYGLVHDKKAQEERRKRDGSLSEFVWSAGIGVGLTASSFGSARLATTFTGSSLGFVLSKSSKLTTLSLGFATRFYVAKSILDNYYTGAVARTAYSYIHRNLLGKREEDLTADYNFYTGVAAGTTALGVPLLSAIGDRQLIKRLSRDLEVNRVSTQLQGVSDAAQQMSQAEIKLGELVNQLQSQQTRLSGMGQAEDAQKLAEQIITTQESIKKATRLVQLRRQGGFFSNFTRNTFNTGRFALDIGTGFVALSVRGLSKNFKVGLPLTAVAATAAAGVAGYQTSSDPFYMTAAGTTAALATTAILGSIYKLTDPVGSRGATELLSIVANQLYHLPGKVHNRLSRNSFYRQKTEQLFGLMDNKLDWLLKDNRNLEAQYGAVPKRVGLGLKPGQVITKVAPALALGSDIFTLYTGAKQVSNLDAMDGSHEYLATYKAFESSRSVIASMSVLNLLARKATFGTAAALILQTSSMGEIRGYEKGVEANLLNLEENYGELTNKRQREYWESAGIGALSLGSTSLVMLSHSKYAQLSTRTKLKLSGSAKNLRNLDKALDFAGARVLPAVVQSYMAHNRFAYMSDDANQQYLVGGNAAYGAAKDSADISGLIGYGVMMAALASRPKNLLLRGAKVFAVVGGLGMGLLDDNLESTFFNNYQKRFQKEGISSYYAQSEIVRKARQSAAPTAFTVGGVQLGVSVLALIASKGKASGIAYNLAVKGLYTTPLSATVAGQIAYQNTIHSEINDRTQYDQGLRPDEAEAHNQYARTGQVPDKYKDTKDARFNQRLNNVLANVREDYIKRVEDQADGTYDVSGYSIGAVPIYKLNQKQLYTDTIKAYKKQVEETKPDLMQYLFAGGALAGLGVLTTILPKEQPHIQATATAALPTNGARVSKLSKVGLRGLHIGAELIAPIFQLYEAGRTSSEASLYNYSAGAKGWGEFLEIESQASAEYTGAQLQGISTAASAPLGHVGKIIVGATAWGTETLIQPIIKSWRKQDLQWTLDQAEQKDPGFIVTPKVLKDLSKIRSEYVREEAGSWTKLKNYLPAAAAVGLGIAAFLAVGAIGLPVLAALGIGALVAGGTFVATKAVMDNAVIQKRQDNYLLRKETRKNLGKSAALRPYQTASITSLPPKEQEPGELETFTDDILTNQYFWGGMVSTVAPIVGFGALSMRALKRVNNSIKHFTFNEAPNSVVEMTSSVQPLASPEATLKPVEPQPITEATLRPIEPQPTVESITQPVQPVQLVQPVQQPDPIQRVQQPEPVTPVKLEPIAAPQTSSSSLPNLKDFLEDFDKPDSILEPSVPTPQPAEQTVVKPVSQPVPPAPPAIPVKSKPIEPQTPNLTSDVRQTAPKSVASSAPRVESTQAITQADIDAYNADPNYWKVRPGTEIVGYFRNDMNVSSSASGRALNRFLPTPQQIATFVIVKVNNETFVLPRNDPRILSALDEGANNVFRYLIKEGKVVDAAKVRLVDNETYEVKLDGNYDLALSKQNSGGAQQQDGGFITLSQAPTTEERKWLTRRRYQRIGSAQAKGIDYQMLLMDMVYGKSKEAVSGVINKAKEIRRPVVQGIRKSAIGLTDRVWTGSWMDGVISRATGLDARFGNVGQVGFFQRWATGARYEFSAKGMFEGLTGIGRGADGKIGIQGRAGLMALAGTGIQFFDDLISGKSAGQIATNVGLSIASGIAFGLAGAGLAALAASSLPALATVGTIGGIALAAYGVYSLTDQALGLSGKVYEKFILGRKRTREESLAWERQRQGIALGAGAGTAIYQGYNAVKRFRFVAPTVARTITSKAGSATATLARSVTSRINPIKALRWTGRAAQVSTVGYSIYQIGSGLQQAFFGESNKARDLGRRKAYREVLGLIGAQAGGALGEQAGSLVSTITVNPITIGASRGVSKVAGTIAGYELATRGADNSYNTVAGWFTNAQSFLGNILSNVPVLGDFFFPKVASAGEIPFGLRSKSEQHKIIQQSARRRTAGANYTLQSIQGKEQKVLSFLDGEKASAQPKEDSLSWWEWLLKKAMETLGSIGQATSGAVKGTVGALGDLGNWMWQGLSNTAQKAWQSTTRFLSQAGSGFIGAVRGSLQSYNNFRRSAWQGVRSFSNWVGSTLGQFVPSAWRSKINTGLSETWVGVANELQNNAMFDPSTREGRAATAVALGLGFIESNPSWSVDQMFSAMGGGGGLMRGFAQIHTGVHARNKWETKQGYTQTVGEWVTGRALTPSSGGRFNLQGFMADIDAGKVTNDPASFYGAMKRHGFRVNDWQALGDGIWRASPNQIQAVLDFYKKGGKLEPTGAQDVVSSSVIKVATPKSGTAFFTGQRTGPKGTMGAGTAYHQHLEFGSAATDAKLRVALVDAIAKGVESQGMKMTMISRFGNRRYNPAADLGTKSGIIQTYIGRHTHSGPKQAVDFFAHEVEGTTQGKEVRMLAPIIPGASYTYRTGGGAGLALYVKDPKGNLIFKLFHGNEQLEKPKDFKMPGEYKGPIPVTVKDIKNVKQTSAPAYPVAAGVPLTSGFGMRVHPITGVKKMHRGVDFGAPMGAPVYAVLDGVVSNAGWNGGYGNQIALTHGNEASSYAHLSGIVVKPGQKVTKGQLIGFIGSTGLSTGPHLHFEWKQKTKSGWQAVNPMPVLKAAQKGINYGTAAIEFVGDPEYRSQVQQNVAITQQTATTPVVVSKALKLFDTFARKDELQQRITTQKNESNEREPLEVLNKALEFEANQLGLNLDEVVKVMQTSRTSLEVVKTAGLWNNPLNYVRRLIKQVLSKQQTAQTQQDSDSVFKPTQSATRKVYRGRGRSESLAGEFIQQKTQALQSGIRQFQQQASQTATQAWEVTKQGLRAVNPFAQRVSSSRQTSEQSRLVSLARSRATNKRRTGTGGRGSNPQPTRLQRVQQTVQRTTQVINKVIQRVGNATRQSWQTIQQGAQKLGNWWNKLTNPKRSQPSKPPKRQGLVISTIPTKYTPQISTQPVERLVASANLSYLINTGINQPQLNPPVALEFSTQRSINLNDRKPQKSTTPPAVPGMYQPTVNQEAIQVAVATTDAEVQATVQAQQNVVNIATAAVARANQIKANQAAKLYEPVPNTNNVASVSPDPYVFAVAAKDQRAKKTQSIAYYDKGEHKVYYAHPVDPRAVEAQLANGSQFIPNDHDDYARGEAVVRPIAS